ncbi:MAG: hypothetical protein U1E93_13240 [Alphaproteobacteria bacterium]
MVDLAPTFLRETATGLLADAAEAGGLREWVLTGTYGMRLGLPGEIILEGISSNDFFPYLLFDYSRFAMAAKESVHLSFGTLFDKRATAWTLINRYYSSFFSAHSLLRAHGRGITWIDASEAAKLEAIGKAYIGPQFVMRRGGYSFEFDAKNGFHGELKLAQVTYGGGSHDDFWRYFAAYLATLGSAWLANNVPLAQQSVARLDELRRIILAPATRGAWLSHMRNEINYQHKYGTWFPFKTPVAGGSLEKRFLKLSNAAVDLTPSVNAQPLKAFNAATYYMAALSNDFAALLKERAGTGATRFRSDWNRLEAALSS